MNENSNANEEKCPNQRCDKCNDEEKSYIRLQIIRNNIKVSDIILCSYCYTVLHIVEAESFKIIKPELYELLISNLSGLADIRNHARGVKIIEDIMKEEEKEKKGKANRNV